MKASMEEENIVNAIAGKTPPPHPSDQPCRSKDHAIPALAVRHSIPCKEV
jgi:hypothetical protein